MRPHLIAMTLISTVFGVSSVPAQEVRFRKILLPIVAERLPIPGSFGSRWATELTLFNDSQTPRRVAVDTGCRISGCPLAVLEPGETLFAQTFQALGAGDPVPAYLLPVEEAALHDIKVELRVRDLSRSDSSWGTELQAVAEDNAYTSRLQLLNVPIETSFRSTLRVYDFDPAAGKAVRVRFFAINPSIHLPGDATRDVLLTERDFTFQTTPPSGIGVNQSMPGYVVIHLDDIPELRGHGRLRIEVSPLTAGLRFWAFASVTNNETQQVTTINPD